MSLFSFELLQSVNKDVATITLTALFFISAKLLVFYIITKNSSLSLSLIHEYYAKEYKFVNTRIEYFNNRPSFFVGKERAISFRNIRILPFKSTIFN